MHSLKLQYGRPVAREPRYSSKVPAICRTGHSSAAMARAQPRRQQASTAEDVTEQDQDEQQQQQEASGFSAVVQRLLHRAASSLTRGTTTCLACKGQGTCTCPSCNGSGVTEKDARQTMMRHTAQKLRSVLHVDRSEYHSDWLTSNRCRRCHGTGVMICPTCQGMGTRYGRSK